jgi:hypothetical protein
MAVRAHSASSGLRRTGFEQELCLLSSLLFLCRASSGSHPVSLSRGARIVLAVPCFDSFLLGSAGSGSRRSRPGSGRTCPSPVPRQLVRRGRRQPRGSGGRVRCRLPGARPLLRAGGPRRLHLRQDLSQGDGGPGGEPPAGGKRQEQGRHSQLAFQRKAMRRGAKKRAAEIEDPLNPPKVPPSP